MLGAVPFMPDAARLIAATALGSSMSYQEREERAGTILAGEVDGDGEDMGVGGRRTRKSDQPNIEFFLTAMTKECNSLAK